MNCEQANTIPADEYLKAKGYSPTRASHDGKILWYISPIRESEKTASFKIDTQLNKWFDHGLSRGGKTVDLAVELFNCSVREALEDIERTNLYQAHGNTRSSHGDNFQHVCSIVGKNRFADEKEKNRSHSMKLNRTEPISHPALLQYLGERKILPEVAKKYLEQIHFSPAGSSKEYFALGWKAGDGYEARNKLFQGFVGVGKDITYLNIPKTSQIAIFEGFMDFLSYLSRNCITDLDFSAVILNSTALKARAVKPVLEGEYTTVQLFLDNDGAGEIVYDFLNDAFKTLKVVDMRSEYAGANDFNEWVMNR